MKESQCCNGDTMQLLHSFFFSNLLFFAAPLMELSAEEVECEITLSTAETDIHLFFLFACDCFL